VEPGEWSIVIGTAVAAGIAFVWARRRGLDYGQAVRLLLGPTLVSPGWKDAALVRLLTPASGKVRGPAGDSPSDYLRAIRELLPYVPMAPGGSGLRASAAAESLLKEIDRCDNEIAALGRNAGPAEINRLSTQLEALEASDEDTRESRELRELVRHQLEVVRRMQGRGEILARQRSHFADLLRQVWTVVREVGESRGDDTAGAGRLAALCAEIRVEIASAHQPA
jgi:hypothetical protein